MASYEPFRSSYLGIKVETMSHMKSQGTTRAAYNIQGLTFDTKIKGNIVNIAVDYGRFEEELGISVVHVSRRTM